MKISTNNIFKNYNDLQLHTKGNLVDGAASNDTHKFDVITIHSNPRQIEERTFADSAAREVSSQMKETVPDEKLQNLHSQIALGIYQIDTHAIASKMLFF